MTSTYDFFGFSVAVADMFKFELLKSVILAVLFSLLTN